MIAKDDGEQQDNGGLEQEVTHSGFKSNKIPLPLTAPTLRKATITLEE